YFCIILLITQNTHIMHTVQLRNLPEKTYHALKDSAVQARRSITQQAIYLIQQGLERTQENDEYERRKNEAIKRLKQMGNIDNYDQEQMMAWIREDRDR